MAQHREVLEQNAHDKAVADIAKVRFDSSKQDVYTNPNGEQNASIGADDNKLYPDIVVLEKVVGRRKAHAIGEVETTSSVNEIETEQWKAYTNTGIPFYLYVPAGYAQLAKGYCYGAGISLAGLRTYKYVNSQLQIAEE